MMNRAVFAKDPTTFKIPNDGVARVGMPTTPQEWETLRWELQSFVCEGEYRSGLERILTSYLSNLGKPRQPAVWVSGFYGSGKSHLLRILDALWRDVQLPDGASARGIVQLPSDLSAQFTELSTAGRREGGLWSASGTLATGIGSSVRLAVLAIVFRAAGLPEKYVQARFVSWLESEGYRAAVERALAAGRKTLQSELTNMYVSRPLAEALLSAAPGFATSTAEVHQLLREQYKDVSEVPSDEFIATLRSVLRRQASPADRLPLALIVLDELQQFLAEDPSRTLELHDVVERSSAELESRLLFIGSGQMQLGSTPGLQRLLDRFTVPVALTDNDVDRVVRSVVLRKDPTRVGELQNMLSSASGEIDRQLAGTRIGPKAADKVDLVPDYPLLPARRRFWEAVLRSVDSVGRAGQLRAQLRIVLEATQAVAKRPLGTVIPADAIYDPILADLQQGGVLPRDTATLIAQLGGSDSHAELRARIAKLAFLIAKLEEGGPLATGVRATADTFADLIVEDLTASSAAVRQRVAEAVEALVLDGTLLDVDGQYILQTPIAAEWLQAFALETSRLKNDAVWLADHRTQAIRSAIAEQLGKLSLPHGTSKVSRRLVLSFSDTPPKSTAGEIPIWIRDGWSVPAGQLFKDAQAAGTDSPVVFVFVPREEHDAIRDALAAQGASSNVVNGRPMPQTEEGSQARSGIAARGQSAEGRLGVLTRGLLEKASVYQGGGNEMTAGGLRARVESAAQQSLARLFPRFADGDNASWGTVIERAKQGNADPLGALGYSGNPDKHPASAEVLRYLSTGKRTGKELRAKFTADRYGWPQDAIDGSLYALTATGLVRARLNGVLTQARSMAQNTIGTVVFEVENVVLLASVKIAVKGLAAKLGISVGALSDAEVPSQLLNNLRALADSCGGDAPLPEAPSRHIIDDLQKLSGNEQVQRIFEKKDELEALARTWRALAAKKSARMQGWIDLQALLRHADGPSKSEAATKLGAIEASRSLLEDPDPVGPLIQQISEELRARLLASRRAYEEARAAAVKALDSDELWQKVDSSQRQQLLREASLDGEAVPGVETTEKLIAALDRTTAREWDDRRDSIESRVLKVRAGAARAIEPKSVSVRPAPAVIRTEQELDDYLRRLREEVAAHLTAGNPVIL